jgi:hypothetical protein
VMDDDGKRLSDFLRAFKRINADIRKQQRDAEPLVGDCGGCEWDAEALDVFLSLIYPIKEGAEPHLDTCPACGDSGWVALVPKGRMVRHKPCECAVGREKAEGVARFVNGNPPDVIGNCEEGA